jgi:ankyrin repeat protein
MPNHQNLLIRMASKGVAVVLATLMVVPIMSLPVAADIILFGGNPLLDAIKANDSRRVEATLAGGEKIEVQDFDGRRPLIYAALIGSLDIVEILTKRDADVNHRDKLGNSALFYAASQGDAESVEALIAAKANKDNNNGQGITPLMAAAKLGHLDVVQSLLGKGANPNLRDYTGRTALMWADWNRKSTIARMLRKAGVRE